MRSFWTLIALVALLAAGCASGDASIESIAEPEPDAPLLLAGRDAISANQGKAHVLWFWGAH